jgi:hypothetical protein
MLIHLHHMDLRVSGLTVTILAYKVSRSQFLLGLAVRMRATKHDATNDIVARAAGQGLETWHRIAVEIDQCYCMRSVTFHDNTM